MAKIWPRVLFALLLLFRAGTSDPSSDIKQLLLFKSTITDRLGSLNNWTANSNPCDPPHWVGIICRNKDVFGLQLENMSLSGQLKLDPLTALPLIRTLSFANNSFTGPLPDLKQFKGLKSVYFSWNKLSGNISDDAFDTMSSLTKVVLSVNQFSGQIPSSLTQVKPLLELWLDNNGFIGEIPDFRQVNLTIVNVSNNNLEGKIPDGLANMNLSMFSRNKGLCGPPTTNNCVLTSASPDGSSPSSPSSSRRKLNPKIITAIVIVCVGVLLALLGATYAAVHYRNQQKATKAKPSRTSSSSTRPQPMNRQRVEQGTTTTTITQKKAKKGTIVKEEREQGRLVFVNEVRRRDGRFELDDLLKASAEVLGSGELGSSYKALLVSGPTVVVKRFKDMNRLEREEFEEHMRRIGRLSHPNLVPLVAYYYRKEEKLLVTDFNPNESLASLLHANRTAKNPALDWPTRLKIVKGIAQGLAYLHSELSSILPAPHGYLKSSNVLLSLTFSPLLSDYALLPLLHHPYTLSAFRSPEASQSNCLSSKSDVWSLGVLILEILTGKLPGTEHYPSSTSRRAGGSGSDLANWVNSVVREEWTGEVFDREMRRTRDGEGEMLSLLQIGLGCCEGDVSKRWELSDAVEKIEELKERDSIGDNEEYSSFGGMTTEEEDFSFSTNNP